MFNSRTSRHLAPGIGHRGETVKNTHLMFLIDWRSSLWTLCHGDDAYPDTSIETVAAEIRTVAELKTLWTRT